MAHEPSESVHSVIITAVKDNTTRKRVAHVLAKVTKNASSEKISARMEKLPWTLTRRATRKRAYRLLSLLERLGATVEVVPPLPDAMPADMGETQLIPGTDLLSETQIASVEELPSVPSDEVGSGVARIASPEPLAAMGELASAVPAAEEDAGDGFSIEPLSLGGILDRAFHICRGHFWKLFAIVAIPWLIAVGILLVVVVALVLAGITVGTLGRSTPEVLILLGVLLIPSTLVVVFAVFYVSQGALIHAVSSLYLGRRVFVRDAFRFVMSRLVRYVLTSFLFAFVLYASVLGPVLLGVLFYFVFAQFTSSGWWSALTWLPLSMIPVYVTLKTMLFDKVVIIEDVAYLNALRRSWSLLKGKAEGSWPRGYFLRLLILLHIFFLLYLTIVMLFQAPATIIELLLTDVAIVGKVLGQVLSNFGSLIAGVFSSVCMVVFYYDIRNRKEGFDLKMLSTIGTEQAREE